MLPTSFTTRGVHFAFLIGPPKTLSRQDGIEIHSAVCEKLGVDDISFKYSTVGQDDPATPPPSGPSRGFSINLERRQGRGVFQVIVDNPSVESPVRFLAQYMWPPSREHVREDLDLAAEAVFQVLGADWQKVLAETRIRGQLEASAGSAVSFLTDQVLCLPKERLAALATPLAFASVLVESQAGNPSSEDPLQSPKRELKIEVLREDSRSLYVELLSQWPQLVTSQSGPIEIDASRIRTFADKPSTYLRNSHDWLMEVGLPLFQRTEQGD